MFAAAYARDGLRELRPPSAVPVAGLPAWLAELGDSVAVAGTGAALLGTPPPGVRISPAGDPAHGISAEHLVTWVDAFGPAAPTPGYARLPDAEVNRLRTLGAPAPGAPPNAPPAATSPR
ncbi:MAG: hypothetical protein U0Y82_11900 [Thermoleophilia bacterium]